MVTFRPPRYYSPQKRLLFTVWFIAAVTGMGYVAFVFKDSKIVKVFAVSIATILYWLGYGRWHRRVFKDTAFDKPLESLKGFSFFLLFLLIYLIVFGGYFTPYFR